MSDTRCPLRPLPSLRRRKRAPGVEVHLANWAALDVETTGLSCVRDSLCEVALVGASDLATGAGWTTLIRGSHTGAGNRIHGLSASELSRAPSLDKVLRALHPRLRGLDVVLAHNAAFDLSFLGEAFRRCGFDPPGPPFLCTLELARKTFPDLESHGLESLRRTLGLPSGGVRHRALADARTVARLVQFLLDRHEGDMGRLLDLHGPPLAFRWSPARRRTLA